MQRQLVRTMVVGGYKQDEICKAIRNPQTGEAISKPTLELHFRQDLDVAFYETAAVVVSDFMRKCTGARAQYDGAGKLVRKEVLSDTKAQIFFLSSRLKDQGWSTRVEHTGKGGGPIPFADISKMSDDELDQFSARLEARANSAASGQGQGGEG